MSAVSLLVYKFGRTHSKASGVLPAFPRDQAAAVRRVQILEIVIRYTQRRAGGTRTHGDRETASYLYESMILKLK
jgi:hypothetical protein